MAIPTELLVVVGSAAVMLASAAVYSAYTGRTAEVDLDNDGESDVTFGSSCSDSNEMTFGASDEEVQRAVNTDLTAATGGPSVTEDVELQSDPTPENVREIGENLAAIKGIGATRAENLRAAGFETAADLYYAGDENLTAVSGIGQYTVDQIREDIGGLDESASESDDGSQSDEIGGLDSDE